MIFSLQLTICKSHVHAHAHAHASFISTTTKPLPDSATNTDYDTLTLNAYGEIGHVTVTSCKCPQNKRPSGLPLDIWLSRLHLELPDMQVFLWLVEQRQRERERESDAGRTGHDFQVTQDKHGGWCYHMVLKTTA
jgi:hypothetical protein